MAPALVMRSTVPNSLIFRIRRWVGEYCRCWGVGVGVWWCIVESQLHSPPLDNTRHLQWTLARSHYNTSTPATPTPSTTTSPTPSPTPTLIHKSIPSPPTLRTIDFTVTNIITNTNTTTTTNDNNKTCIGVSWRKTTDHWFWRQSLSSSRSELLPGRPQ